MNIGIGCCGHWWLGIYLHSFCDGYHSRWNIGAGSMLLLSTTGLVHTYLSSALKLRIYSLYYSNSFFILQRKSHYFPRNLIAIELASNGNPTCFVSFSKVVATCFVNKLIIAKSALGSKPFVDHINFCLLHLVRFGVLLKLTAVNRSQPSQSVGWTLEWTEKAPLVSFLLLASSYLACDLWRRVSRKSNFISNENTKMSSAANSNSYDRKTQFARFSHIRFFAVHSLDGIA